MKIVCIKLNEKEDITEKPLSESRNYTLGVSCRNLYSFVVYLYVNGSGSITSVGEERANLSAVVYL